MKRISFILPLLVSLLLTACGTTSTVPITGRRQHLLVSDAQVLSLSQEYYTAYMQTARPSQNSANTALVKRVGQRLATAVETYLRQNGLAAEVSNYAWEFNLVQDQSANAFCMPGGKIVVYEGILPYTQDEPSLAIVLGHEIAHAVAKHSQEQLSKQMRAQYGAQAVSAIVGATAGTDWQALGNQVFGFGANSLLRSHSRSNESEADYMGLIFAAMAGYDPNAAVSFWQRMAAASSSSVPEFFSDHPSDARRIADIRKRLPEALKYYKPAAASSAAPPKAAKTVSASAFSKKK